MFQERKKGEGGRGRGILFLIGIVDPFEPVVDFDEGGEDLGAETYV